MGTRSKYRPIPILKSEIDEDDREDKGPPPLTPPENTLAPAKPFIPKPSAKPLPLVRRTLNRSQAQRFDLHDQP